MSANGRSSKAGRLVEARQFAADLRGLGMVSAPVTLGGDTLALVGLADKYALIETPLGPIYITWSLEGLSLAVRAASATEFEAEAQSYLRRRVFSGEPPERLARGARAWLSGEANDALRFDLQGMTSFERAVLMKTREIPRGEVRPYSWVAREIGHPRAVRAVGTAMARNPIPLFIPCHRVVRADGHLGAYGLGGPESKRRILSAEGVDIAEVEALADAGVRYVGSDSSSHVYCYPTCHHAYRIDPEHRVTFASEEEAHDAGYRPCHVCRPPEARLAS